jgi:deazaflavin-dependent oxidoreductase (nitroreductase family)
MSDVTRRRRIKWFQRYLLNPPAKVATWAGLVPGYVLLETRGRRSGKRRRNVVGMRREGGVGWVVAEQGRYAGYVCNLQADPHVRVRLKGRWRSATAELVADDDPVARLATFGRPTHAATVKRFGTDLSTIRIDLSAPT